MQNDWKSRSCRPPQRVPGGSGIESMDQGQVPGNEILCRIHTLDDPRQLPCAIPGPVGSSLVSTRFRCGPGAADVIGESAARQGGDAQAYW